MAKLNIVQKSYLIDNKRLDADFFQKKYIELDTIINGAISIQKSANTVDLQSNGAFRLIFDILNDNRPKEVPYIRSGNVGDFFINKEELHSISKVAHSKLRKTHTQVGDILMARKGKIGGATLITEDDVNYNSNDNVTNIRLKNNDFLPAYFVAFWNSKYGLQQVERYATGNVQPWLSMKQIRMLRTVKLNYEFQKEVSDIVLCAYSKKKLSFTLYKQATDLLEQELGLDKISFEKPKSYTASFSEVATTRRMNAEYFSPLIKEILNQPFLKNSKPLTQLFQIIRGTSPSAYYKEGIPVLKTKNIRIPEIDRERISDYVWSTKDFTTIQENDLLLASMGVGSLGRMSYIFGLEQDYIVDGTIRVLRKRDETPANYEIPTLLFLSSKVGQELIYRGIVGSTGIISLPDEYLNKIPVPQFEINFCLKITELVKNSMIAKKQSHKLLADAKARVEQLIEEAANK